jgi:hypothetical protein
MARIETYDSDGNLLHSEDTDPNGNENTLREQAAQAIAVNKAFVALAAPTNAQTLAEVKALARQVNALIRLQLADFTSAD